MRCHSPDSEPTPGCTRLSLRAGIGVHLFQQLDLLLEARGLERIDVGIELARCVRAGRAAATPEWPARHRPHRARRRARSRLPKVPTHGHSRWLRPPPRAGRSPGRCRRWRPSAGRRRRQNDSLWLYSRNSSPSSAPLSASSTVAWTRPRSMPVREKNRSVIGHDGSGSGCAAKSPAKAVLRPLDIGACGPSGKALALALSGAGAACGGRIRAVP